MKMDDSMPRWEALAQIKIILKVLTDELESQAMTVCGTWFRVAFP